MATMKPTHANPVVPVETPRGTRYYFTVSFKDNAAIKELGAEFDWDLTRKSWFIPEGVDPAKFKDYLTFYNLEVSFLEKDQAKERGALWDRDDRVWYAAAVHKDQLKQWSPQLHFQPHIAPRSSGSTSAAHEACDTSTDELVSLTSMVKSLKLQVAEMEKQHKKDRAVLVKALASVAAVASSVLKDEDISDAVPASVAPSVASSRGSSASCSRASELPGPALSIPFRGVSFN